jgi:hypothetical protein
MFIKSITGYLSSGEISESKILNLRIRVKQQKNQKAIVGRFYL